MVIENVIKKVKEKVSDTKKKIAEADKKHPWLKYVVIACGGSAIYRCGFHQGCNDAAKANVDYIKQTYPEAYDIIVGKKIPAERKFAENLLNRKLADADRAHPQFSKEINDAWKGTNYRENLEKLIEFAHELSMKPNEGLAVGCYYDTADAGCKVHKYVMHEFENSTIKLSFDD